MEISEKESLYLHKKLPIGTDERILGVFHHHPFVYVLPWLIAFVIIAAVMSVTVLLTSVPVSGVTIIPDNYKPLIYGAALLFCLLIAIFAYIPMWIKTQEQLVLTDEALLQILQPSLFSDKVSQLGLQHIADVSVRQDFLGNMFGYGQVAIETPGEQDNYVFTHVPKPHQVAKEIIEAHENFAAALESGRVPTSFAGSKHMTLSPEQYEEYLNYQQVMQAHRNGGAQQAGPVAGPQQVADGSGASAVAAQPTAGDPSGDGSQG